MRRPPRPKFGNTINGAWASTALPDAKANRRDPATADEDAASPDSFHRTRRQVVIRSASRLFAQARSTCALAQLKARRSSSGSTRSGRLAGPPLRRQRHTGRRRAAWSPRSNGSPTAAASTSRSKRSAVRRRSRTRCDRFVQAARCRAWAYTPASSSRPTKRSMPAWPIRRSSPRFVRAARNACGG